MNKQIKIEAIVYQPADKVWEVWTLPQHIMLWNHASDDWYTPEAENDLRTGGSFHYKMAARDGSFSFDFGGKYDEVIFGQKISYTLDDGRKVSVDFLKIDNGVKVAEVFEAEDTNSLEMQKAGWQAILDNFKKHAESV